MPLGRLLTLLVFPLFVSCDAFYQEQKIPAYINIPDHDFVTNYALEGSDSEDILDVWVYVNDQAIGVFEIPFTVPVLETGPSKIQLFAGVKNSGFESQRENYPFYQAFVLDNYNLVEDSIHVITPTFQYKSGTTFHWIEDFESNKISIDPTVFGNVEIEKTNLNVFEGSASGRFEVTETENFADLISTETFELPRLGAPVFLEMDFNCDIPFEVFLRQNNTDGAQFADFVLGLNPTDGEWKKIYIELTRLVSGTPSAQTYQIIFRSEYKNSAGGGVVKVDNIKLLAE